MTKNKHDHTATKKIKALLFAIMLLLPFLFLLPTGLYYGLNQNAQLSETTITTDNYYQWSENNTSYTYNELQENTIYRMDFTPENNDLEFNFSFLEITAMYESGDFEIEYFYYQDVSLTYDSAEYTITIDSNFYYFNYVAHNHEQYSINFALNSEQLSLFEDDFITQVLTYDIHGLHQDYLIPNGTNTTITYTNDISTSIINAWNSTWQNPLFSWTNYSPFYAPMQSFTNVFGINDMQIANVLTYLATITAIYIVFDIVIELFTYLTHLIPRSD